MCKLMCNTLRLECGCNFIYVPFKLNAAIDILNISCELHLCKIPLCEKTSLVLNKIRFSDQPQKKDTQHPYRFFLNNICVTLLSRSLLSCAVIHDTATNPNTFKLKQMTPIFEGHYFKYIHSMEVTVFDPQFTKVLHPPRPYIQL